MSVFQSAWDSMPSRREALQGLYLNPLTWKDSWLKDGSFPYMQPVNDPYALGVALDADLEAGGGII